jgi:heme/copper-type cytochrome/quinol oxidase subunit 2
MKKLFLLFALIMSVAVYAQTDDDNGDDFLVKVSGDTIRGKFKYKGSDGDIKNKISIKVNDTLKISLKAADVKYFREGKDE